MKGRKKQSRKIPLRSIRPTTTYTLPELAKACEKKLPTVWRYRRDGMPVLEGSNGKLVDGAEFIEWAKRKNNAKKRPCKIDEFYCFGGECRTQRRPAIASVFIKKSNQNLCSVEASCEICGTTIRKGWSMDNLAEIEVAMESFMGNIEHLARYRDSPSKRN